MAGLKVAILGPKVGKRWGFSPLKFVRGRTNIHIRDKLFQDTSRRVPKFRENRPRDIENSVDGKKLKTRMWANAQRDGHLAEYRWRPLFNAAKFG